MRVGAFFVDIGLVDVVGPDGVEGGDVAGHSGHEAGEQRGEAEAEDSGREEVQEHDRDGEVVVVDRVAVGVEDGLAADGVGLLRDDAVGVLIVEGNLCGGAGNNGCRAGCHVRGDGDGDEAGQDDEEREEHLGDGGDEGDAAGGDLGVGGHGALDDEEVRAPVAEGEHEAEAHGETDPLDAEGVGVGVGHAAPGVRHGGGEGLLDSLPSAYVAQADPDERGEAGDDEEELQDLVIDGAGEAAEEDVAEDDDRREEDRDVEDVGVGDDAVEEAERLDEQRHRVHRDAGGEHGHEGEGEGVDGAGLLVEAHAEVLGHGARLRAVVERHHEDADEDHGGDGADPVEVAGDDAVLGARGAHADDLLRSEVGGDKGEAADPGGDGASGEEEVVGGAHVALEGEADAQNEDEIDQHDQPVDDGQTHRHPWRNDWIGTYFGQL